MAATTTIYTGGGVAQLQSLNTAWAHTTAVYYPKLFPQLATGQSPQILWIGCSDSRIPETELLGLLPGEVFVHRNIANAVNPDDLSLPAALQYAVDHVKVQHVIVCGHIGCGGIAGTCATSLVGIAAVDKWLAPLRALLYAHASQLAGKSSADEQLAMVKINLANSVAKISADQYVAEGIAKGTLQVHGAIYDVGTGLLNFLSASDVAVTATDPPFGSFNNTHWFNITNAVIGAQKFIDIQNWVVQCNGPSGTYPNQHWKFTNAPNGSFTMSTSGLSNVVATVDQTTLLISMKPLSAGDTSMQQFRPSTLDNGATWSFTCDALPTPYKLGFDPATSTLMMSNAAGLGAAWIFSALRKV